MGGRFAAGRQPEQASGRLPAVVVRGGEPAWEPWSAPTGYGAPADLSGSASPPLRFQHSLISRWLSSRSILAGASAGASPALADGGSSGCWQQPVLADGAMGPELAPSGTRAPPRLSHGTQAGWGCGHGEVMAQRYGVPKARLRRLRDAGRESGSASEGHAPRVRSVVCLVDGARNSWVECSGCALALGETSTARFILFGNGLPTTRFRGKYAHARGCPPCFRREAVTCRADQ